MPADQEQFERNVSRWLLLAVIALCLAGGGAFVWWAMRSPERAAIIPDTAVNPSPRTVISTARRTPAPTPPPPRALPQATDPGATLVNLALKDVSAEEAFAALAKQAQIEIIPHWNGLWDQPNSQHVNLSLEAKPFWVAFMQVCKQAQVGPNVKYENPETICINRTGENLPDCPISADGSCAVILKSLSRTRYADLVAKQPPRQTLYAYLIVLAEPKAAALGISPNATVELAEDDAGNSLLLSGSRSESYGSNRSNWISHVSAALKYPSNPGKRITRLKGYVSVITQAKTQTMKIHEPLNARNVTQKFDDLTVRIQRLTKSGQNAYMLQFVIDAPIELPQVFRNYEYYSRIARLMDANGKEFNRSGGGSSYGRNHVEVSVHFRGESSSAPSDLELTVPTGLRELRVPFEFKDLLMP